MDREQIVAHLIWDDRAIEVAEHWGLTTTDVAGVVRHGRTATDPHAAEVGYEITRYIAGDVTVVVGFRDPDAPKVLHVRVTTDRASTGHTRGQNRVSAGRGPGSDNPTSQRDMKLRILALGYRFEVSGGGHLAVVDKSTGRRISYISSTPRPGRGIIDDWKRFLSAHNRNTEGA